MTTAMGQTQAKRKLGIGDWLLGPCRCQGEPIPGWSSCASVAVKREAVDVPDLAIYSQEEALGTGLTPTWDNPDIFTNTWPPLRLMNEAVVVVRNLSPSTPAINVLVHYSTSPFGIGTPRQLLLSHKVNIPAGNQIRLQFPLDQTTLNGDQRVGVHIEIEHPHDRNQFNNRGSQVVDASRISEVGRTHSIQIPVVNNSDLSRQIQLSVLPTEILASITPSNHTFAPREQILATLQMEVPSFLLGTPNNVVQRAVTVVGRLATNELIGGVTKLLGIDI